MSKKKIIALVIGVLVIAAAICIYVTQGFDGNKNSTDTVSGNSAEREINEDDIVTYENLEDAKVDLEFDVSIPEEIEGYTDREVSVIDDDVVEATYHYGEKTLIMRKSSIIKKDISGIKDKFENEETLYVNNIEVTIKGNGDTFTLALWNNNGYSFSVYYSEGVDKMVILSTVVSIL